MRVPSETTVEGWAYRFILSTSLEEKLHPRPVPQEFESEPVVRRIEQPGRPKEFRVVTKSPKTRGLFAKSGRARALHSFFHHELQAAELMAWAVLAFADVPPEFKRGLIRIALDEVRHMGAYARQIERLGFAIGDFPVRDWFWQRVPACPTPASFVATMGLGFEGANLEHSSWFAARFREAGDEEGATVQEQIGREEIAHVKFGVRWFEAFTGRLDFDSWRLALPPPLSPLLMRGKTVDRMARRKAGLPEGFVSALEAWSNDAWGQEALVD